MLKLGLSYEPVLTRHFFLQIFNFRVFEGVRFELTNNPVSVSVDINEVVDLLLDLREHHVAVTGDLVLLDVDHDPVISTHIPDKGFLTDVYKI